MDFKQVFNFPKRIGELLSCFKNIKDFDFLGRLKSITKDIPGLAALAGGTLMLIATFIPNFYVRASALGIVSESAYMNQFQTGWGWLVFVLTLAILGLAYFKQTFWAGLTSALCMFINILQVIIVPAVAKLESVEYSWYSIKVTAGAHVGWYFLLLGELAVIGAFVLYYFVLNKNNAPAVAAPVSEVTAQPVAPVAAPVAEAVAEPVAPVVAPVENTVVTPVAPAVEEAPTQAE